MTFTDKEPPVWRHHCFWNAARWVSVSVWVGGQTLFRHLPFSNSIQQQWDLPGAASAQGFDSDFKRNPGGAWNGWLYLAGHMSESLRKVKIKLTLNN